MGRTGESHTLSCFNSIAQQGFQVRTSAVGGGRAVLGAAGRTENAARNTSWEGAALREGGWAGWRVLLREMFAGSRDPEVMAALMKGFRGAASSKAWPGRMRGGRAEMARVCTTPSCTRMEEGGEGLGQGVGSFFFF